MGRGVFSAGFHLRRGVNMNWSGDRRSIRTVIGVLCVITMAVVASAIGASMLRAAPPPPTCNLVPQLRDVTVNQGVGAYSPLVNGKETLVRFYLSMPCGQPCRTI